ncbi:J domain-containing protein [Paraburkholderia sp. JHI869]|uniref:J domain-containing protein n=1 Tax=Paraburkholderia sp. JHI869 TaxID=3112959 RepID=UPI003176E03E
MANIRSHYERLSIARDAPPEVIRAVYKALSQKWHPDRNQNPASAEMMQAINVAYATLSDPAARIRYDQWLESEEAARAAPPSQTTWTRAQRPAHERPAPNAESPQAERRRGRAFEIDEEKLKTVRFRPPPEEVHWARYILYFLFPLYIPIDLMRRKWPSR